ncbi:MAG TPA: CBS domain-containing protein [Myxococcota bacterium]|nr:CBS domain-containing protein [Myxococcota bacterium]
MTFERDEFDESYFETPRPRGSHGFDARLLREPLTVLPTQRPITLTPEDTVTDAMRAMQREHRGCVLVTDDGTARSKVTGIFTERDVLFRIVDRGRNPASLPLGEVMTPDPDTLSVHATVAHVLNRMAVGGFRHVPVVDDEHRPYGVISVREVVTFLVDAFPREVLNLPNEVGEPTTRSREGA